MTNSRSNEEARLREQRRTLSLWLEEWRIHKAMEPVPVGRREGKAGHEASADASGAFGPTAGRSPEAGQVRLLRRPPADPEGTRPVYVVVLRAMGPAAWLIAPFSRFAHPAIPGEWQTGLRAAPLRVLSLWNARIVTPEALWATWFCRTLTRVQLARMVGMLDNVELLDPDVRRRAGPPVMHPLDPRHAYVREERELLDAHPGCASPGASDGSTCFYEMPESEHRKAAEPPGAYGKKQP